MLRVDHPQDQDFRADLQGHPSPTYPSRPDPLRTPPHRPDLGPILSWFGPEIALFGWQSGPNQVCADVFGGGRAQRGRSGWDGPVGPPKVLTPGGYWRCSSRFFSGWCAYGGVRSSFIFGATSEKQAWRNQRSKHDDAWQWVCWQRLGGASAFLHISATRALPLLEPSWLPRKLDNIGAFCAGASPNYRSFREQYF